MASLLVHRAGGVVTVTLNRPATKNALTQAMLAELGALLGDVATREADRVLVLQGAGGDFCSGADLSDGGGPGGAGADDALRRVRRFGDVAVALHDLCKPTIACVDGVAVGAGLGLALACDLVVASDRARFSTIFSRRALSPDTGTSWLLARSVGPARAKELAFFSDLLSADAAEELGLVNRVVPAGTLEDFVSAWAVRLAGGPARALAATKSLLDGAWSLSLADSVEQEAQRQVENLSGADVREALAAFRERRPPRFEQPSG